MYCNNIERMVFMNTNEALDLFSERMYDRNLSPRTLPVYRGYVKQYLDFTGVEDVSNLNLSLAQNYVHHMRKKNLAIQTINASISAIRYFSEIILDQPYSQKQFPRLQKSSFDPFLFSDNQIIEMLSNIESDIRLRIFILLGLDCGLRSSEVAGLQIKDIDSQRMLIHIRDSKRRKSRDVKMSQTVLNELRNYCKVYEPHRIDGNIFLFFSAGSIGGHISHSHISHLFKKYVRQFSWYEEDIHFHCLRHTFATRMLENGCDIFTLKKLLGHRSFSSTSCYIHLTTSDIQNVVCLTDKLGITR